MSDGRDAADQQDRQEPRGDAKAHRPILEEIGAQIFSSILTFDRTRLEPLAALRCTLGVALPLAVALAADQRAGAVFIAVGAVSVGFGSFQGAYRSRATIMLLASVAMAWSIFVGSLTGSSAVTAIAVSTLWSFAAGMLVAFGPAGAFIGLQSTIAVIIADAYPSDVAGAALRAAMVFAGGLVQTLFVVSIWPFRRFREERRSTARLYRELASYVRTTLAHDVRPTAPSPVIDPSIAHADPHPFASIGDTLVFQALDDEAERLRATLAALTLVRDRATLSADLAAVLDALADAIHAGHEPTDPDGALERLEDAASTSRRAIVNALMTQLHAAWQTAEIPVGTRDTSQTSRTSRTIRTFRTIRTIRTTRTTRTIRTIKDSLTTLRANLSFDSAVYRHALRLAIGVGVATAMYRLTAVPRGYWIPMTTLLVLRPEFTETFITGGTRIAGTLAGGLLGTVLVLTLGTHQVVLTILLLVFVWCGYTLFRASYTLFTVCFTGYVVLVLTLSGVAGPQTAQYRIVNTIAGGLLALLIYAAWPTWESRRVRETIAIAFDTLAADVRRLLGMVADPSTWSAESLRRSRDAARLARSNVEASVDRMLSEPGPIQHIDPQVALGLLAGARRYALAALAVHAALDHRPQRARPSVGALRDQIAGTLEQLAVRMRQPTVTAAPLPLILVVLADDEGDDLQPELEMMADAVNGMAALVAKST